MNAGTSTIDWLFDEQLRVDDEWSKKTANGFIWWASQHAQRIEVIGSETGPAGDKVYHVRVKTELVRELSLSEEALAGINLLMSTASMSGPVYDAGTRILNLSSLVTVHEGIRSWMSPLISVAAMQQIADAHFIGPQIAGMMAGTSAESGHPENGFRPEPDELAVEFPSLVSTAGEKPSSWSAKEFQQAVDQYMQQLPSLLATAGGKGLTVEFPYGGASSLCQMKGDQKHPRIGNGLFLQQSFPVEEMSVSDGTRLALELNAVELDQKPAGYGFGSYCYRDCCIHFTGFMPNAAYRSGLLPNLYFACAGRARAMSIRFTGDDWSNTSERKQALVSQSAFGRFLRSFRGK